MPVEGTIETRCDVGMAVACMWHRWIAIDAARRLVPVPAPGHDAISIPVVPAWHFPVPKIKFHFSCGQLAARQFESHHGLPGTAIRMIPRRLVREL